MQYETLIVGGGFAGVECAKVLGRRLGGSRAVALVSERNYMVFHPLLAEVCGSGLSAQDIVSPIRQLCRGADVYTGRVERIDLEARTVGIAPGDFTPGRVLEFRHLVLAMGSVIDLRTIPGMAEHAHLMKDIGDALRLRATLVDRLEEANWERSPGRLRDLLTVVVVGGGFSGVETAGQILDFLWAAKSYYANLARAAPRVVLVHSQGSLLPELHGRLGAYAETQLRGRGMEIILGNRVIAVTTGKAFLRDGRVITAHTVVSTIGNSPNPAVAELCGRHSLACHKGRVVTDRDLRIPGWAGIWAAGDCAAVPSPQGGKFCPPTAQFAVRQGRAAAENILRERDGRPRRPFRHRDLGQLASIGRRKAVGEILGLHLSGFPLWFLWRTLYLFKLPGVEDKLRVMVEWTFELFFPRDITRFRPEATSTAKETFLPPGTVIFEKGDPAPNFYLVKSGGIETEGGEGAWIRIGEGGRLDQALLDADGRWGCGARTTQATRLVYMDRDSFMLLAETALEGMGGKSTG